MKTATTKKSKAASNVSLVPPVSFKKEKRRERERHHGEIKRRMRGREKAIREVRGREISCPIQGHGSVHVLSRHHLLQEHVGLPVRRAARATAKTCRSTTITITNKQTNISDTHTHTPQSSTLILLQRVSAAEFQLLKICNLSGSAECLRDSKMDFPGESNTMMRNKDVSPGEIN